jgi:hypothetical protein
LRGADKDVPERRHCPGQSESDHRRRYELWIDGLHLIPAGICYNIGANSSIDASALPAFFMVALYIAGLVWLASHWLERRELLLH